MNGRSEQLPDILPDRRQSEVDQRRQAILTAAEALFASAGYHDASIAEIARRSGFAAGTIYLYFKDKADLYGCMILGKMQRMVELMDEALRSAPSAPEALRKGVHAQFEFQDRNRSFFEIFLHQHQVETSPLHQGHWTEMEQLKRRNLEQIERCIKRGQKQGEVKAGNSRLYAVAYLGIVLQMIRQWLRDGANGRLADSADFAAECFLSGAGKPAGNGKNR